MSLPTTFAAGDAIETAAQINTRNGAINGVAIGDPVSKTINTSYLAATDGFVNVFGTGTVETYTGYTDASDPPTTVVAVQNYCICFPVKKGDYYKATRSGSEAYTMYFTPYGS